MGSWYHAFGQSIGMRYCSMRSNIVDPILRHRKINRTVVTINVQALKWLGLLIMRSQWESKLNSERKLNLKTMPWQETTDSWSEEKRRNKKSTENINGSIPCSRIAHIVVYPVKNCSQKIRFGCYFLIAYKSFEWHVSFFFYTYYILLFDKM